MIIMPCRQILQWFYCDQLEGDTVFNTISIRVHIKSAVAALHSFVYLCTAIKLSFCKRNRTNSEVKNYKKPWLVWLSGLSTGLCIKGSPVQFPVRAHAWGSGQVPSRGRVRGNHTLIFLSLSFSSSLFPKNK